MRVRATLAAWIAAGVAVTASAQAEGVAALVGSRTPSGGATVILRSDVDLRARLRLAARLGEPPEQVPGALMDAVLEEAIGEALIEREALRLRAPAATEAEVEAQRTGLVAELGGAALVAAVLASVGASQEEIVEMARRRAVVDGFLRANLAGALVVTDLQVERAYEAGRHPFPGRELDEVREALRVWLRRQRLEREVARWIAVLRGRTTVRVLARWS